MNINPFSYILKIKESDIHRAVLTLTSTASTTKVYTNFNITSLSNMSPLYHNSLLHI